MLQCSLRVLLTCSDSRENKYGVVYKKVLVLIHGTGKVLESMLLVHHSFGDSEVGTKQHDRGFLSPNSPAHDS